jgi:hypothetical protein
MSAREMVKQRIDYVSDALAQKVYTYILFEESLERKECPICKADDHQWGPRVMQSLEDAVNDVDCETIDDYEKYLEELAAEDD